MGDVYLAATTGIEGAERPVVVKTVRRDHIHDGSFLARFLDEARVQAQLNHPGVAQVLEASTDENGEPFTVVEYVEGRSLADVRQRAHQMGARIGWPEAVAIAIEMAHALTHVHERSGPDGSPLGIVHRDLSPQNVMLGYQGEVKLIDFGTARGHNRRCHTVAGVVFAKPGYVAPEVARQQMGDGRIDVYALGVMLWELCAGKRMLEGDPQAFLEACASGDHKAPSLADMGAGPPELDEVIAKLTANLPDDRYPSAAFAATDLARVLSAAPPMPTGERSVRARVQALMKVLWPHEPARTRTEFMKLLRNAEPLRSPLGTPPAGKVAEIAAARMNDDPAVLSGTPYRLLRKLGEGASGVVLEAEHIELGRKYAVKILAPTHGTAEGSLDRFRQEARAVAKLCHPNIVGLHDFGKSWDGRVFLAMELLSGTTLDARIKGGPPIAWCDAVEYAIQVTHALEAAHRSGIVHRDLKPANLFLTNDGCLKLLDFGVAVALSDVEKVEEQKHRGFAIFGTPEYMAPEQIAGESIDARCDLYALGCVLYELVTGTRPFAGGSSVMIMGQQLRELPEPPRVRKPALDIPREVEAVILRALQKDRAQRFASAAEMRLALEGLRKIPVRRRARVRQVAAVVGGAALLFALMPGWLPKTQGARAIVAAVRAAPHRGQAASAPVEGERTLLPEAEQAASAEVVRDVAPPVELTSALMVAEMPDDTHLATAAEARDAGRAPQVPRQATRASLSRDARAGVREEPKRADKKHLALLRSRVMGQSSDPQALRAWAQAAFRAGELREARRAAELWAMHDGTAEPRLLLAAILDAAGQRPDAKALLAEWLEQHPDAKPVQKMHAKLSGRREADERRAQLWH